jgi:hypothetical protein
MQTGAAKHLVVAPRRRNMEERLTEEFEACYKLTKLPIAHFPTIEEMGTPHTLLQRIYRSIKTGGLEAEVIDVICSFSIGIILVKMGYPDYLNIDEFIEKGSNDNLIRNVVRLAMRNPKLLYRTFSERKKYSDDNVLSLIKRLIDLGANEIIKELSNQLLSET